MKKRAWLLIALLSVLLVLNPLETEAASASDLTFTLNEKGNGYIVSDCRPSVSGKMEIPETYMGLPVTGIGSYAFYDYNELTSIVIPDSVITIGSYAFSGCAKLSIITIGSGVTSIGENAFAANTILNHVYINDIKAWCEIEYGNTRSAPLYFAKNFYLNGELVTDLVIPEGTTKIAQNAFIEYDLLTTITIPDSVTSIGKSAFQFCKGLTSVTIPDSVTSIDEWAFADCDNLKSVVLGKGVTDIGYATFANCDFIAEFTITDCVVGVRDGAFSGANIEKLIIANGAKTITQTMVVCPKTLRYVEIPATVTSIAQKAFCETRSLKGVYIHDIGAWCQIEYSHESAGYTYNPLALAGRLYLNGNQVTDLVIPDDVPYIADFAFTSFDALTSVTIPDSVESIGEYAFSECSLLTEVTIPESLKRVGKSAFASCENLSDITLGNNVVSVGSEAFHNTGLHFNTYQNGKYLGNKQNPYVVLVGTTSTTIESFQFHPDTKVIAGGAFQHCTRLTGIAIPNGIVSICDKAFETCNTLKSVSIPNSVTRIENAAFKKCYNLRSIKIPDSVTAIEEETFFYCSGLSSVTIPESVTYIGCGAFQHCTSLADVTIPDNVTCIDRYAFGGCSSLTRVIIPESVSHIGDNAFEHCTNLADITIPETVSNMGRAVFVNCSALTELKIPSGITVIRRFMFEKCIGLTSIIIPDSVTDIEIAAFDGCEKLATVIYCGTPQQWSAVRKEDHNQALLLTTVQYHNYENSACTICQQREEAFWEYRLDGNEGLAQESSVYINGLPCEVKTDGDGRYLELPKVNEFLLVTYTYHKGDGQDVHTQYPTGMKVYLVKDGKITHIPELDNLLQYSGASIRITGKKGIRMITSIEKEKKTALTGKGLAGYKLLEYGTALCFASEIPEGDALVLGRDFTRSNYAYKKGKADPVFATTKDLVQYTNVLVGFSLDQCKDDIAMRPYIILEDAQGNQVTLYGGTIYRSIGYIAYQNRTVFKPKTASYNYVWEIIHHVYGDKYDADYKG